MSARQEVRKRRVIIAFQSWRSTSFWWTLTQSFLASQRMKKARMKEERGKEKKKDTEEEAQKERASDMYSIFYLS